MQFTMTRHGGLDPIPGTWIRGLIATAIEWRIRPLCWHIQTTDTATTATGYVTVSLLHEAAEIRKTWADALELTTVVDDQGQPNGYSGCSGPLAIHLPDAIDPDEHCQVCGYPFDPRDPRPHGRARYEGGDTCRSCASELSERAHLAASSDTPD